VGTYGPIGVQISTTLSNARSVALKFILQLLFCHLFSHFCQDVREALLKAL